MSCKVEIYCSKVANNRKQFSINHARENSDLSFYSMKNDKMKLLK